MDQFPSSTLCAIVSQGRWYKNHWEPDYLLLLQTIWCLEGQPGHPGEHRHHRARPVSPLLQQQWGEAGRLHEGHEDSGEATLQNIVWMYFCTVLNYLMVEIGYCTVDEAGRRALVWDVSSSWACWEGLCPLWKNTDIQTVAHTMGKCWGGSSQGE